MRNKVICTIIVICTVISSCSIYTNDSTNNEEINSNIVLDDTEVIIKNDEDISNIALNTESTNTENIHPVTQNDSETSELIEDTSVKQLQTVDISNDTFVNVKDYIPEIIIDLKYATDDNFTEQKIYNFSNAYLRYGTVQKLIKVQNTLQQQGLSLKIWDAFRPTSAQFILWEICPDSTYVANPNNGFSSHSRGNTIDITLVNTAGEELTMPTGFDDFSKLADRDYSDCSSEATKNALLLEELMIENGFKAYSGEWWHFTDLDSYPVEETFYSTP